MARPRNRTHPASVAQDARDRGDFEVGYGRPPEASKFKPGKSGNPKGRPRKNAKPERSFEEFLQQRVPITGQDGRTEYMTRRELAYLQTSTKAAKGDHRAFLMVVEHDRRKSAGEGSPDPLEFDDAVEEQILEEFKKQILESDQQKQGGK